jgi:hypothetical protein
MKSLRAACWRWLERVSTVGILLLAASCGDGRFKPTFPVQGSVTYMGEPAAGAKVFFHSLDDPDDQLSKPMATVQADGSFVISTYRRNDGMPAGEYTVTVIWLPPGYQGPIEQGNKLPMRYSAAETSGLKASIAKAPNELPVFELTE